jgi:hypothetical protein
MGHYNYVGPLELFDRATRSPCGVEITSPGDVRAWLNVTSHELTGGVVIATYVILIPGRLRIADRRSEHVACAGGSPVLSAGEITFAVGETVQVVAVSNQSTGYCPEPESWPHVADTLENACFQPPAGFSPACVFRRCVACGSINIAKGGDFTCAVCDGELPAAYNAQPPR